MRTLAVVLPAIQAFEHSHRRATVQTLVGAMGVWTSTRLGGRSEKRVVFSVSGALVLDGLWHLWAAKDLLDQAVNQER